MHCCQEYGSEWVQDKGKHYEHCMPRQQYNGAVNTTHRAKL